MNQCHLLIIKRCIYLVNNSQNLCGGGVLIHLTRHIESLMFNHQSNQALKASYWCDTRLVCVWFFVFVFLHLPKSVLAFINLTLFIHFPFIFPCLQLQAFASWFLHGQKEAADRL